MFLLQFLIIVKCLRCSFIRESCVCYILIGSYEISAVIVKLSLQVQLTTTNFRFKFFRRALLHFYCKNDHVLFVCLFVATEFMNLPTVV